VVLKGRDAERERERERERIRGVLGIYRIGTRREEGAGRLREERREEKRRDTRKEIDGED
jgi:hypothetical protein